MQIVRLFERMGAADNNGLADGRGWGPVEPTNNAPGGLPGARSVEEALARIENAIDDLADLTGPVVLDG